MIIEGSPRKPNSVALSNLMLSLNLFVSGSLLDESRGIEFEAVSQLMFRFVEIIYYDATGEIIVPRPIRSLYVMLFLL